MSNYLALAATTAAFASLVRDAMHAVPPNTAQVRIARPSADPHFVGAHLFLYRVTPNPSLRNNDLPTRDRQGTLIATPRYPADLEYLLSFYGDEQHYEPQRLMGRVITAIHVDPVLSPGRIHTAIELAGGDLAGSDLDVQAEPIKLIPITLDLQQLSQMWSVFYQIPYRCALAYQASAVWLDGEPAPPPPPPPKLVNALVAPDPQAGR